MLDPYVGNFAEFFIDVKVGNPKLEDASYISYEIKIETNNLSFSESNSMIRRRYSDFVVLHKLLTNEFLTLKTPSLPSKLPFQNHFHPAFVEKRRNGLEEFIKKLVSEKIYLSSKALHLFLQSSLSMPEIKNIIQGKDVPITSKSFLNTGITTIDSSCNISENRAYSFSSHAESYVSENLFSVCSDSVPPPPPPPPPNNIDKRDANLSAPSKKVSFCDQVTVAQIHAD